MSVKLICSHTWRKLRYNSQTQTSHSDQQLKIIPKLKPERTLFQINYFHITPKIG